MTYRRLFYNFLTSILVSAPAILVFYFWRDLPGAEKIFNVSAGVSGIIFMLGVLAPISSSIVGAILPEFIGKPARNHPIGKFLMLGKKVG